MTTKKLPAGTPDGCEITGAVSFALFLAFGFWLAGLSGCNGGAPGGPLCEDLVNPAEPSIVDGELSTDRRSTVQVFLHPGGCSGTIVGAHTVLTAAHCARDINSIMVEGDAFYRADSGLTHPDYSFPSHDLHLLYFDDTLPEPYATIGLAAGVECYSLLAQGYGIDSGGALHEREIFELNREFGILFTTPATCNGDSGGPAYGETDEGMVQVGVTSFGTTGPTNCRTSRPGFVDLQDPRNGNWVRENTR